MLKRAEPGLPEDSLLMRALRDFNTPKIVHSDEVRACGRMPLFCRGGNYFCILKTLSVSSLRALSVDHNIRYHEEKIQRVVQPLDLLNPKMSQYIMS